MKEKAGCQVGRYSMRGKCNHNIFYLMLIINIILMVSLVESQQSNVTTTALPESKSLLSSANVLMINGTRFNDSNLNGIMDDGEKGLAGAIIRLMQNGTEISITVTNEYGRYFFNNLNPGQYTIVEERVNGWNQTSPPSGSYNVTLADSPIYHLDFGDTGGITTNPLYTAMYKSTMNLSNDWVLTPFGPRLRSNYHKIKQGNSIRIGENGSIQEIDPSGKIVANYVAITPSGTNMSLITGNLSIAPKATPNTPNTPSPLTGRTRGLPGTPYSYSTSATDPDGDQVKYTFDWDDGTSTTTGLVNSGTIASETHSWAINNVPYQVKAMATDSTGASSGWSASLPVTIFSWVTDASWTKNAGDPPIDSFTTTWDIPPAPATQSGQLIYLFNGIQNSDHILQPVLQWGPSPAGGGNYWAVASWYVGGIYDPFTSSDLVQVNPGDALVGIITRTGASQTGHNYNCQFQGRPETSIPAQNIPELTYFVETLEAYNIQKGSDYPDTDITALKEIGIQAGSANPTVDWTVENQVLDFGQYTEEDFEQLIYRNLYIL